MFVLQLCMLFMMCCLNDIELNVLFYKEMYFIFYLNCCQTLYKISTIRSTVLRFSAENPTLQVDHISVCTDCELWFCVPTFMFTENKPHSTAPHLHPCQSLMKQQAGQDRRGHIGAVTRDSSVEQWMLQSDPGTVLLLLFIHS